MSPTRRLRGGGAAIDDLLSSQIAYYRAHAPKYDDWWCRTGKHDLGEDYRRRWDAEIAALDAFLEGFAPFGHVLEFAGGTGNWTAKFLRCPNRSPSSTPHLRP